MENTANLAASPSKGRKIAFMITHVLIIIGMLSGGAAQLFRAGPQVEAFVRLGFPLYFMTVVGLGKILGGLVLLIPQSPPLLKVGAYTGLFFVTTSAVISHAAVGDWGNMVSPAIVAILAVTACLLNPRISFTKHSKH